MRHSSRRVLIRPIILFICTPTATLASAADEQNSTLHQQVQQLLQQEQQQVEQIKKLETQLKHLQEDQHSEPDHYGAHNALNISLTGQFAAGISSVGNETLKDLQVGGHDPSHNGFNLQNLELAMGGTVNKYLQAQSYVVFHLNDEGETAVELEEAFFTSRELPWGLRLKGGQFFTRFGQQNAQHPHDWAFVDQALILSRLLGAEGLRSQGLQVSCPAPLPWYSKLYWGVQNPKGETVTSFLYKADERIGPTTLGEHDARTLREQLHSLRWQNRFDVSETARLQIGISSLYGPNASSDTSTSYIHGLDFQLTWHPTASVQAYPFVNWHTELMQRNYEGFDSETLQQQTLKDAGMFSQLQWGFKTGWIAAVRADYADAKGDNGNDPLRDKRQRLSSNVSWLMSDHSKLRLQYNRDWAEHLAEKTADTLWLQIEFNLGRHTHSAFKSR